MKIRDLTQPLFEADLKLGGKNPAAEAFMDDLFQMGQAHPFERGMVLINGVVGVRARPFQGEIHLSDIVTYLDTGQGKGTEALQALKGLADKHGVAIEGIAKAYSQNPEHIQDSQRLAQWYKKHGFEIGDGDPEEGFEIRYEPQMREAPIDDYALIGNWGDREKSNSYHDRKDRKLVQSPKMIERTRKAFGQTEHVLNLYFANLPGLRKFMEHGVMTPDELAKNMPKAWELIKQRQQAEGTDDSGSINVIFTTNAGVNKVPMTPWIMAHRIGHAINAGGTGANVPNSAYYWKEAEKTTKENVTQVLEEVYNWRPRTIQTGGYPGLRTLDFWNDPVIAKFFEAIGTMRSARRDGFGGRPYEFLYELFAQYVTTGDIKFNKIPRQFGLRGKVSYQMQDPKEDVEYGEMMLNRGLAWMLPDYFDTALGHLEGHYLVM